MSLDTGRAARRPRPAPRRRATDPGTATKAPARRRRQGDEPLPLIVAGAIGGAAAAGVPLMALGFLSLAAWMLAPAAELQASTMLEVAGGAWLAGQGLAPVIQGVTITLLPWGFGLISVTLLAFAARWAGNASAVGRRGEALVVAATASVTYGVIAALVALLARNVGVSPLRALVVCTLLAFVVTAVVALRTSVPGALAVSPAARDVAAGALTGTLLLLAAGALAVLASLLLHMPDIGLLLSGLQPDVAGAIMLTVLSLAYLPVVCVWGTAYLLGPGFAIGDGHLIAPLSDTPATTVPGLPLLAALPAEAPVFGIALPLIGVLAGAGCGWLLRRRGRTGMRGAGIAALSAGVAGIGLGLIGWLCSGSLGEARLAALGPAPVMLGLVATGVLLIGALAVVAWPSRSPVSVLAPVSEALDG